jgi:hypothetical protein
MAANMALGKKKAALSSSFYEVLYLYRTMVRSPVKYSIPEFLFTPTT